MNKALTIGVSLLVFSGIALAGFSFDFQIELEDIVSSFIVPLTGNLTQDISGSQGEFKYFLDDGSGFADNESSSTSIWDSNISSGEVAVEAVSLNEDQCDVKIVFDGTEYDVNNSTKKLVFPITSLGQRVSIGAYLNSEGTCSGSFADLNVVMT